MNGKVDEIDRIYWEASQLASDDDRKAYLGTACGDNTNLRRRVEKLLSAQPKAERFLERPFGSDLAATLGAPSVAERPGTLIGPYKLIEEIGEGGMGVVYLAMQKEPVRRQVALKIIRPGMGTREVITRFEAERQALALMDHPNIAHVLDAGATESGRPYFVMELVHGASITDYCDQHDLTIRERLELFVTVCQAVQHAHHKGIIHRDLKPSNVLVTVNEDAPVPKVIDFGVAKATDPRLTDGATVTGPGQLVGTPMYMSPEQAGRGGQDVDTRSDVYSLGVLLYELLTGTPPFDKERFHQASYDEICDIIRDHEPPRPSTRVTTVAEATTTVSAHRRVSPAHLSRTLRGELDWIVMKALEKDRNRRYETASDFAQDIQRYLNDEPVQACPPSAVYRLGKFARRHRAALVAGIAVLTASVVALVAMTLASWSQRQLAQRQQEFAQQRLQVQQGISDALTEAARLRVRADMAENREGVLAQARDQVQRALTLAEAGPVAAPLAAQVRRLSAELDRQQREHQLLAALDRAWLAQADMVDTTFDSRASLPHLRAALQGYGIRPGERTAQQCATIIQASSDPVRKELIGALHAWSQLEKPLSGIYLRRPAGDFIVHSISRLARPGQRECLRPGDRIVGVRPRPGGPTVSTRGMTFEEVRRLMASAVGTTAKLEVIPVGQSEPQVVEFSCDPIRAWLEAVLDVVDKDPWRRQLRKVCRKEDAKQRRAALEKLADEVDLDRQPLRVLVTLAQGLRCVDAMDSALNLLRRAWQPYPDDVGVNLELALLSRSSEKRLEESERYYSAGQAWPFPGAASNRRLEESERYYTAAIALRPDSYGLRINLGTVLHDQVKWEEAIAAYEAALRIEPDLAIAHNNLGVTLHCWGRLDEAVAAFREALRLEPDYADAHNGLACVLRDQRRLEEATAAYRKALQLEPDSAKFRKNLAHVLYRQMRLDEAVAEYREILRLQPDDADAHKGLGWALTGLGKLEEATAEHREAVRLEPTNGNFHGFLGIFLLKQEMREEALAEFREAVRLNLDEPPDGSNVTYPLALKLIAAGMPEEVLAELREAVRRHPQSAQTHYNLGVVLARVGHEDEAVESYREALRVQPDHVNALNRLSPILLRHGKGDEAVALYDKALQRCPQNFVMHCNYSDLLRQLGRESDAIAACREAIRILPYYARAHALLALLLTNSADAQLRRPEEALTHALKAVESSPTTQSVGILGVAQYRAGQWQEAIQTLEKSSKMPGGGHAGNFFFLSMANWQIGNRQEAKQWYDKAVARMERDEPDDAELIRLRAEAEQLLGTAPAEKPVDVKES